MNINDYDLDEYSEEEYDFKDEAMEATVNIPPIQEFTYNKSFKYIISPSLRGNTIMLEPKELEEILKHNQGVSIFKLKNPNPLKRKEIYVTVHNFNSRNKLMGISKEIYENLELEVGEKNIEITLVKLPQAKKVKFKIPEEIKNPKDVLEFTMMKHQILYEGQEIVLKVFDEEFIIKVTKTEPAKAVCILNTDLKFDIEY